MNALMEKVIETLKKSNDPMLKAYATSLEAEARDIYRGLKPEKERV